MTKIYLIAGFLGAGKTSVIEKIIGSLLGKEKICVVENEFGEVSIDANILRKSGAFVQEINQGCICCSLVGDFRRGMEEILDRYQPDRVFVEPSGVAKLSDLNRSLEGLKKRGRELEIESLTVVDGARFFTYRKNFRDFYQDQLDCASAILLSHMETVNEEEKAKILDVLSGKKVFDSSFREITGEAILGFLEGKKFLTEGGKNISTPNFSQWFWDCPRMTPIEMEEKIKEAFNYFSLYRAKGFFSKEKSYLLQAVPKDIKIIEEDGKNGIVLIGEGFTEKEMEEFFHDA